MSHPEPTGVDAFAKFAEILECMHFHILVQCDQQYPKSYNTNQWFPNGF